MSGGCVEGAVYELGEQVLRDGRPVLQRYGVSDDDAFAVGLTCGGIIDLFVEKVNRETFPQLGEVADGDRERSSRSRWPRSSAGPPERLGKRLVVWPDRVDGTTGSARLDDAVRDDARGLLDVGPQRACCTTASTGSAAARASRVRRVVRPAARG